MWDWRQQRWLNYMGWWPRVCKTKLGYRLSRFYGFALFFFDFVEMGPELVGVLEGVKRGSFANVILNLSQILMGFLWSLKIATLIVKESKVIWIINKLEEMDKKARHVMRKEVVDKFSDQRNFRCSIIVLFNYAAGVVTFLWLARPPLFLIFREKVNLLDAWVPFDTKENNLGWTVNYIGQSVHVTTAMMSISLFDTYAFCILEMVRLQYDYLKHCLSNLHYTRDGVDRNMKANLRFCISFHQDVVWVGVEINNYLKDVILFQSMIATLVICLCAFQLSDLGGNVMTVTNVFLLGFGVILELFIYCFLCQGVEEENLAVMRSAYNSNWYEGSLRDRKALWLLIENCKLPRTFGRVVTADLSIFIAVLKSAFSYYQFLGAISE